MLCIRARSGAGRSLFEMRFFHKDEAQTLFEFERYNKEVLDQSGYLDKKQDLHIVVLNKSS